MQLDQYRKVFAVRGFPLVMALGLLAKLPVVAIPIILTLHVTTGFHRGYAQAGLVIGLWTTGATVGAPVSGRLVHRYGLRPVLAISTIAQGLFWGLAPQLSFPIFAVGALASGLLLVSGSTVVRLAVGGLVPQEHRHTAFAVDSMITEVAIMAGPPLAVLAATQVSTKSVLVGLCFILVVSGSALVAFNPRIEGAPEPDASNAHNAAATPRNWLTLRLVAILACSLAAGAIVNGYEVAIVGTLRSSGQLEWTGLVLLGAGACSLVGGLVFGALRRGLPVPMMIGLLALCTMPLGLVGHHWWALALAVAPAAALVAPGFAATANAASQQAADGNQATVMSIYSSALSAGGAVGAPLAGAAFDAGGSEAGFAAVGGLGLFIASSAWLVLRHPERIPDDRAATPRNLPVER